MKKMSSKEIATKIAERSWGRLSYIPRADQPVQNPKMIGVYSFWCEDMAGIIIDTRLFMVNMIEELLNHVVYPEKGDQFKKGDFLILEDNSCRLYEKIFRNEVW